MKNKEDESICLFGAGVILKQVLALAQEVEGVRAGQDIECIHRMRVASRRLRCALPVFLTCLPGHKSSSWQKQIRSLTRALGAARDADVQIDLLKHIDQDLPALSFRPGMRRLLLRRTQKRAGLQHQIDLSLDQMEKSDVLSSLQAALPTEGEIVYTDNLYKLAFQSISGRLDDFLSYEPYVDQPERVEELHAMRISAKWLRYTMEIFAPLYPRNLKSHLNATRKCQECLGEIHDCDVWTMTLPLFMEKERQRTIRYFGNTRAFSRILPGLHYFQQNRYEHRQEQYQVFLRDWAAWKREGLWADLSKTITLPVEITRQVFPVR